MRVLQKVAFDWKFSGPPPVPKREVLALDRQTGRVLLVGGIVTDVDGLRQAEDG
jgi:hypothetical protein